MRLIVGIITLVAISSTAFASEKVSSQSAPKLEKCSALLELGQNSSAILFSNDQRGYELSGSCVDNFMLIPYMLLNGIEAPTKLVITVEVDKVGQVVQTIVAKAKKSEGLKFEILHPNYGPTLQLVVERKDDI